MNADQGRRLVAAVVEDELRDPGLGREYPLSGYLYPTEAEWAGAERRARPGGAAIDRCFERIRFL